MPRIASIMIAVTLTVALVGCRSAVVRQDLPPQVAGPESGPLLVLAGDWEYEESGVVQMLRLNGRGIGTYGWKGGRFITTSLIGQVWSGSWQQTENDREGGFEITLSPDYAEGTGRWWYTRIEEDHSPARPGGMFTVRWASNGNRLETVSGTPR